MTALTAFVAATLLPAADANAAGFALKEQSGAAQGNSFAGATAGAEDVTYMFFNPGRLDTQEGHQAAVVLSYIIAQRRDERRTAALRTVRPTGRRRSAPCSGGIFHVVA